MWRRIYALVLRYVYLHKRSQTRIMEIVFWPVMGLLVWGFFSVYMQRVAAPSAGAYFLGAIILWEVLYRSQQAISYSITEEFWVRNVMNLFISPLSVPELVAATCAMGLFKSFVTTLFLAGVAFLLYGFDLFAVGLRLVPYYGCLLVFGWAVGLLTMGVIFRYGRGAEALIWGVPFLMQPISAVFYPADVLPGWLWWVAMSLPSTHVFEGMRAVLAGRGADPWDLALALGLNLPWLALGGLYFGRMLARARQLGNLGRQVVD
jgi:ABC-2 type transport system permease protein